MFSYIFQDLKLNNNFKSKFILVNFRLVHYFSSKNMFFRFISYPYRLLYRIVIEWFMGVELNEKTTIGKVRIFHGQGLIINPSTIIGDGCTFRSSTTIGNKPTCNQPNTSPVIGNNVDVGANSCIIGPIVIGDNVIIGAGSIVVQDIPSNCIVAGNPSRVIREIDNV